MDRAAQRRFVRPHRRRPWRALPLQLQLRSAARRQAAAGSARSASARSPRTVAAADLSANVVQIAQQARQRVIGDTEVFVGLASAAAQIVDLILPMPALLIGRGFAQSALAIAEIFVDLASARLDT